MTKFYLERILFSYFLIHTQTSFQVNLSFKSVIFIPLIIAFKIYEYEVETLKALIRFFASYWSIVCLLRSYKSLLSIKRATEINVNPMEKFSDDCWFD
jgi:hypothetical protein